MQDTVRVLHVDEDSEFAELVETNLTAGGDFEVELESDPEAALERVRRDANGPRNRDATDAVDCVVSDDEIAGMDGLDLLREVRDVDDRLPFVLFTSRGSAEGASDAISAGVTDCIEKRTHAEQYELLANRVRNAVEHYRTERALRESEERVRAVLDRFASRQRDGRDAEKRSDGRDDRDESDDETRTVRRADGSWAGVESAGRVHPLDGTDEFVVNSRDATARREREQRLRRYESVVHTIRQRTYVLDADRRFEFVNDAVIRRTALTREDIVGRPLTSLCEHGLIDEEAMGRLSRAVDRILDGESGSERVELDVDIRANVDVIEINLTPLREDGAGAYRANAGGEAADEGAVTGVVAVSTDVTQRRQYQERLESLHEASRELTRATTYEEVAGIVSDAATEILDYPLNGVFFREEGTLVPSVCTESARETFDGEPTIPRGEGIAWQVLESGEGRVFGDVTNQPGVLNPDTPIRSELIHPIGDEGVLMAGSTEPGVFDDSRTSLARILVSNARAALERVDREQLLRRRERELERQNEQLERVANVVSHDLRNPLNVAHGQVELLERAYERGDESEVYRRIGQLSTAHDRMRRIIGDMLDLARHGRPVEETSRFPLGGIVANAWETTEYDRGELVVEEELGSVRAHDGRLVQLFENLFRNAMEHNEGTETTITVGRLDDEDGFYVADDGTGIPRENRESVFEPGMSTRTEGTGLGLGIVRTIVDGHGWTVSVTESEDGGARFEIRTESAENDRFEAAPR